MKNADISRPVISELLDQFEVSFRPRAKAGTRRRLPAVRAHLTAYLETDADDVLTSGQRSVLELERSLGSVDAFASTMHADDLFYALCRYLEPEHAMPDPLGHRVQVDVVAQLCEWMWSSRLISFTTVSECMVMEVEHALDVARARLRRESAEARGR